MTEEGMTDFIPGKGVPRLFQGFPTHSERIYQIYSIPWVFSLIWYTLYTGSKR